MKKTQLKRLQQQSPKTFYNSIFECTVYFLLFGGLCIVFAFLSGGKGGHESGWLGINYVSPVSWLKFTIVSYFMLAFQYFYGMRLLENFRNIDYDSLPFDFTFSLAILINLFLKVANEAGQLSNLFDFLGILGWTYFILPRKIGLKSYFFCSIFLFSQFLLFQRTGGRGYILTPLVIFLYIRFPLRRKSATSYVKFVAYAIGLLTIYGVLTLKKFEGFSYNLAFTFGIGRLNQLDSLYLVSETNVLRLSETWFPLRLFESIDYFSYLPDRNPESELYDAVFSSQEEGGFSMHPFAECLWTTESYFWALFIFVILTYSSYWILSNLTRKFSLIKLAIPLYVLRIFIFPESIVVTGSLLLKFLFILIALEIGLIKLNENSSQRKARI